MIRMMGWFELWMYVSLSIQPPICLSIREPFLSRKQDILMELSTRFIGAMWKSVLEMGGIGD